jgi:hypothetical protein
MKHFKKFLVLLVLLSVCCLKANTQNPGFSRSAFYAAMSGNDIPAINSQLAIVRAVSIQDKDAYEGALLIKKPGL